MTIRSIPARWLLTATLPLLMLGGCGGSSPDDESDTGSAQAQGAAVGTRSMHRRTEPGNAAAIAEADGGQATALHATGQWDAQALATAAARPFPHHVTYTSGVIKPSNVSQSAMDSAVQSRYASWKSTYLRTSGGQGTWVKYDDTSSTVSEAHGYGMVISAYMGDKTTFDAMVKYFKAHPSVNAAHLMAWKQTLSGGTMKNVEGADSATDGDLDIAYGLLLADVQWGSTGTINYKSEALAVLHDVLAHDVNQTTWTLKPGDWASGSDANHTRPSDFMTSHFLAFAKADSANATKWNNIYDKVSSIVNYQFTHGSGNTGLMPDFMVKSSSSSNFLPVSGTYLESSHDGDFDYNACRTPWRLSMSYIVNGRTDMLAPLQKQAAWIRSATGSVPTKVRAGYYVKNGTNGRAYVSYDDLAFTAPMAVNAMLGGGSGQTWLNNLWTSINGGDYGSTVDYYGDTIRLQVMLTVSGNWWTP
ncbi:glycosyl hydrolase family 8 [Ideonella sp. BN130291]|uniref:glycosyl hydrolase family 8 n=1 Tax=Ideonella sp. BN130291 TaxID=3112940 RepID=UPI002E2552BA|nr:glycosyl hydrolase family 8 [Ideonella sp. BN130291]